MLTGNEMEPVCLRLGSASALGRQAALMPPAGVRSASPVTPGRVGSLGAGPSSWPRQAGHRGSAHSSGGCWGPRGPGAMPPPASPWPPSPDS